MYQTKLGSLFETCIQTAVGYVVATTANYILLPIWFDGVTFGNSLVIGLVYTFISVARGYVIRRFFNSKLHNAAMRAAEAVERRY